MKVVFDPVGMHRCMVMPLCSRAARQPGLKSLLFVELSCRCSGNKAVFLLTQSHSSDAGHDS